VILAFLAVAFVVLLIAANLGCAPKYFQRADVVAALVLAVSYALVLGWACLADDDVRRVVGATASAGLATLFLSSASIPVLAVPVAVAAIIRRLPRSGRTRWILVVAVAASALLTVGVLRAAVAGVTPDQFRCP
jgi:hypothetical protein